MPITKEFLGGVFEGIENPGERIGKVLAEYDSDITGLKRNNIDLVNEKKKLADDYKALQDQKTKLESSVKDLDEKLKAGLPEEQRKHYEVELQSAKDSLAALAGDRDKQIAEREAKIAGLLAQHHDYVCQSAFNDLVNADPSIFPEMREILKSAFFVQNKFKEIDMPGEGKKLLNDASKSMKDALTEFLNTPGGQRFRKNMNDGGGAPGSGGAKPGQNMITREQLNAMSATQRSKFFAEGGKLAS